MSIYRRDIDGLRALAVVPVILFHAGFDFFSGGYVGVDVFFVISGYLIATVILSDLEEGKFSLLKFYERRARRILPALFLVMAFITPAAFFFLNPFELVDYSQSLIAVALFSSNILFWSESGYFETDSELKPLLHTWSLAVEEQYYVFFPVFMLLVWRIGRYKLGLLLSFFLIFSLALAHYMSVYRTGLTSFYMLPTRAWELLLGVIVAVNALNIPREAVSGFLSPSRFRVLNEAAGCAGILLILAAVLMFEKDTPTPSLVTLVPTFGTVLILMSGQKSAIVMKTLGNKIFVNIGLISYSLYLWHQPLLAFARHYTSGNPSWIVMSSMCLLTLPAAYLSWRFVEVPFRNSNRVGSNQVVLFSVGGLVLFLAIGTLGYRSNGFETIWLESRNETAQTTYRMINTLRSDRDVMTDNFGRNASGSQDNGDCRFNAPNVSEEIEQRLLDCFEEHGQGVVILGDSHAIDLYGVVTSRRQDDFLIGATQIQCRPHTPATQCQYEEFFDFIQSHSNVFSHIIYEQAGFYLLRTDQQIGDRSLFNGQPLNSALDGIYPNTDFVDTVNQYLVSIAEFVPVLWLGPRVEPHISIQTVLDFGCDYPYQLRPGQQQIFEELDLAIERATTGSSGVYFLSQIDSFEYSFPADFISCDSIYWSDGDHLSIEGEVRMGERFDVVEYFNSLTESED